MSKLKTIRIAEELDAILKQREIVFADVFWLGIECLDPSLLEHRQQPGGQPGNSNQLGQIVVETQREAQLAADTANDVTEVATEPVGRVYFAVEFMNMDIMELDYIPIELRHLIRQTVATYRRRNEMKGL